MERAGSKEFEKDTERKGLGTPATRASIIEKLLSSGYAVRKGKQLLPTKDGEELYLVLPDTLKSASLTAEWENQLLMMEHGNMEEDRFMTGIMELVDRVIENCREIPEGERFRFYSAKEREQIGTCPWCGSPIYEGKNNFYCENRECRFVLWKDNRYLASMRKRVDKKMAKEFLKSGRTHAEDLYSQKKDDTFAADILMTTEDGRISFSLEFPKRDTGRGGLKKRKG